MKSLMILALSVLSANAFAADVVDCSTTVARAKAISSYQGVVPACGAACAEDYILDIVCPRNPAKDTQKLIADALINKQIRDQVLQFGELVKNVSTIKVQSIEDADLLTFTGTVLKGGDIACGNAGLQISRTSALGFGGQRVNVYKAAVIKDIVPNCQ